MKSFLFISVCLLLALALGLGLGFFLGPPGILLAAILALPFSFAADHFYGKMIR